MDIEMKRHYVGTAAVSAIATLTLVCPLAAAQAAPAKVKTVFEPVTQSATALLNQVGTKVFYAGIGPSGPNVGLKTADGKIIICGINAPDGFTGVKEATSECYRLN
jgi:hypothetical protein